MRCEPLNDIVKCERCPETARRTVWLRGRPTPLCTACAYKLEPQREDYIERKPGSSLATTIALAVFVLAVGLAAGWAFNSVFGVF